MTPGYKDLIKSFGSSGFKVGNIITSLIAGTKFGGESKKWLLNQISEFYPLEEKKQFGFIGIELSIELILE